MKINLLAIYKTERPYPNSEDHYSTKTVVMVYKAPVTHDQAVDLYVTRELEKHSKRRLLQFQAGQEVSRAYRNAEEWLRAHDISKSCFHSEEWEVVSK